VTLLQKGTVSQVCPGSTGLSSNKFPGSLKAPEHYDVNTAA